MAEWVAILLHVLAIPGSNLNLTTGYYDRFVVVFLGYSTCRIVPDFGWYLFPFTSFPFHYHLALYNVSL
jgi:hypothetical protein